MRYMSQGVLRRTGCHSQSDVRNRSRLGLDKLVVPGPAHVHKRLAGKYVKHLQVFDKNRIKV